MEQELRVRVLGGAELAVSGRPLVGLASAKATALLVYLAVTGSGHSRSALAWTRAIGEAERLAMPWELANAHHELGRHLAADERSPLGLDRTGHLDRARSTFQALGCRTDPTGPTNTDDRPT